MAITNPPPAAGEIFSDDLINEILLRLPVKSLLRCQSVSRTWLSLITNPSFAISQLRHAVASFKTSQTLIVKSFDVIKDNKSSISLLNVDSRQIVADLKFPYSRGEFECVDYCTLVGSANGILCVSVTVSETYSGFFEFCYTKIYYLWNPATRHSKVIRSYRVYHDFSREALRFGFDKVVRVFSPPLAFDLNKEVLNCGIKFPVKTFNARIIEFNESIAVILSTKDKSNHNTEMWKLDNEACLRGGRVESPWTKMFNVNLDLMVHFVHGCFRSGDLLLTTDAGEWYLYDSNKKEAIFVPVILDMHEIFRYTESLVQIPGFQQVNWGKH